jgi:crotonobetainyl-CoA:carnitine CoA-transferase CaiB-like acyl-CoA transferase
MTAPGPLAGVRVLDLSRLLPGGFCSLLLADYGADREEWEAFAAEHECCLEPVLELDEALSSEQVHAREMIVGLDQPGVAEVRLLGAPVKLSRTPADCNRLPGPALGEHTEDVLRAAGYDDAQIRRLFASGAVAGPPATAAMEPLRA